jgi:hypothetical protein
MAPGNTGGSKKLLLGSATRHSSSAPLKVIDWAHRSASPFSSFDRSRALPRRGPYFFCGQRDGRTTGNLNSVGASATFFFKIRNGYLKVSKNSVKNVDYTILCFTNKQSFIWKQFIF